MKVILMDNAYEISKAVSSIIIDKINNKPNCVLGFATGASPVETYKRIIESRNFHLWSPAFQEFVEADEAIRKEEAK